MIVLVAGCAIWMALMICATIVNEKASSTRAKEIARSIMAGAVGLGAYFRGEPNKRERDYLRREKIRAQLNERRR